MVLPVPEGGGGLVVTLYVIAALFGCPFQLVKPVVMLAISDGVNPGVVSMM